MRVYIPATREDLHADDLAPELVHAVTPALRALSPEEDEEVLEAVAYLAAADDSTRLVGARSSVPQRVVLAADVPASSLLSPTGPALETALAPAGPIPWDAVVSVHVDEVAARPEIAAAARGDEAAFERSVDLDLLWFDATERAAVEALLDS